MLEITWEELEAIAEKEGVPVYVVLDQLALDESVGKN